VTRRFQLRFVLVLFIAALAACDKPLTVEQQIIATIRNMEAKVEAGERRPFMEHVAGDFSGQDGAVTREQLQSMVLFQMNRNRRLQAQLFPIHVVESSENIAVAHFRALVTGGKNWLPERGQVLDFETHWRLEDNEWMLSSANWTPVPLEDAL
jgi:hypothetical protein